MRKLLGLAATLVLVFAAPAAAGVTHQFGGGFNCSATAFTPQLDGGGGLLFSAGESCAGSQFNYYKSYTVCAQILGSGGVTWFDVTCSPSGRSQQNPLRVTIDMSFNSARSYRTEVRNATVDNGHGTGSSISPIGSQRGP